MRRILIAAVLAAALGGCATVDADGDTPLEKFNRAWNASVFAGMSPGQLRDVNRSMCVENVAEWDRIIAEEAMSPGMRAVAEAERESVVWRCTKFGYGD